MFITKILDFFFTPNMTILMLIIHLKNSRTDFNDLELSLLAPIVIRKEKKKKETLFILT